MIPVLLFARAPRLGTVKSRLAAAVGEEAALTVYRALGRRVVEQIAPVSSLTIWYDPPDALGEMRAWLGEHAFRPQPEGDLGARITFGFREHFAAHPDRPVLAVGADAPEVDGETILAAARALAAGDVVIGPAQDGGYYLIGVSRPYPELFEGIPWGTSEVCEVTTGRCLALGTPPVLLPKLRDVDRLEDLAALGLWPP
jgi:rSAM/selenodomain-associated transferase 1